MWLRGSTRTYRKVGLGPGQEEELRQHREFLTFWRRNYYFFLILAHPVYKM